MTASLLQVVTSAERRGAEVFALDLQQALRARGLPVETVALAQGDRRPLLPVTVLGRRPLAPATLWALRQRLPSSGAVVAHGSTALPATALARVGRRTTFVYRSIGDPTYWRNNAARRSRTLTFLRGASGVVVLWQGAADAWVSGGVPRDRLTVIPNGVPATRFPMVDAERREAARRRLTEVPAGVPLAVYIGALSPEKNVAMAIRSVARTDAHLAVVGGGPQLGRLEALGGALAPGRVHFLGGSAHPAEPLAASDVLLLPSRTEGMPAVLIEAGLSGVPVVATDVGAVSQIVLPEKSGLLVEPDDEEAFTASLHRILEGACEARDAGRAHCLAHFEISVVARQWDELLSGRAR